MQGAQAIPLGVFNDHDRGVGHIHAHLDDRGGDEGVQPPGLEILHDGGFLLGLELAVHQAHPPLGQQGLGNVLIIAFDGIQPAVRRFLDGGADDIYLPPGVDLPVQKAVQRSPLFAGDAPGLDRLAARRKLIQNGDVQVAVDQQAQRAGDGGSAHDQQVGVLGLFGQHPALADAKAVLLVHHGQAQPGKFHALAEDGVGADD